MNFRGCAATVIAGKLTIPSLEQDMSIEENLKTTEEFVSTWLRTPDTNRRVEEIISEYNETHRIVDKFAYQLDEKGLYVQTKTDEEGPQNIYIREIIENKGYPESAEATVFNELEKWSNTNEKGLVIWVSPPYPEKYPCSKIIVHQIAYEFGSMKKVILNGAILFDAEGGLTLETLHELFPETSDIKDLESFRSVLIKPNENFDLAKLVIAIKNLDECALNEKKEIEPEELIRRSTYISTMIGSGAHPRLVAYEMQRLGLIGEHSISCPSNGKIGFSELTGNANGLQTTSWEYHPGVCRVCGASTEVGPCSICKICEKRF